MKKTNKKGFTIVELVIVIAVIAILAAVLIPTFAGVVTKAKQSAALTASRNAYTELMAETNANLSTLGESEITASTESTASAAQKILAETGVHSFTYAANKLTFVVGTGTDAITYEYDTTNGWKLKTNS